MRRLIRFPCGPDRLSASLDEGARTTGLICVTGGTQIRSGPHRLLHQLAVKAASAGYPVFRYERRGLGDSDGVDPGYRRSGPDLVAAAAAFRQEAPHVRTLVGFGLCDGATTLALHGEDARVDVLVLANPWLVETEEGDLAPAATRAHYRGRLLSPGSWAAVLSGKVDILGAAKSLFGSVSKREDRSLADEVASRLPRYAGKLALILSSGDGTAIAAKACWNSAAFASVRDAAIVEVSTDAHTFAREGDLDKVATTLLAFMQRNETSV